MSKTVVVTIETVATPFPAGTVPTGINISLSGGVVPAHVAMAAPYAATFTDVAPGTYTATAQAIDSNGAPLGAAAVSAEFTITADPDVNVDIPSIVTVSIQ